MMLPIIPNIPSIIPKMPSIVPKDLELPNVEEGNMLLPIFTKKDCSISVFRQRRFFLIFLYNGNIRKASLLFKAAPQIIMSTIDRTCPAAAGHKIMHALGFNLIPAHIAANRVPDNFH